MSNSEPEGGGWPVKVHGRFNPEKGPVPIVKDAGWEPGPVGMVVENVFTAEIRPPNVERYASRYTDWANLAASKVTIQGVNLREKAHGAWMHIGRNDDPKSRKFSF
jgi:hypothetical protein